MAKHKKYKHKKHQIDLRDHDLITYHSDTKRYIVKLADMANAKIEPMSHAPSMRNPLLLDHYIWLWSEELQTAISYSSDRPLLDAGLKIGVIFVPCLLIGHTYLELTAHELSVGTELHIIHANTSA